MPLFTLCFHWGLNGLIIAAPVTMVIKHFNNLHKKCNPLIMVLPASLSEASWNCSPCFAQKKTKAWVSEQVQGQKLLSAREMTGCGWDGEGTASAQF